MSEGGKHEIFIYKYMSCLAQIKIPTVMTSSEAAHFSFFFLFDEHVKLKKKGIQKGLTVGMKHEKASQSQLNVMSPR